MESLDAVEIVLREAACPLHYRVIAERVLARKLWSTEGKTPPATINSRLAVDIQQRGPESRFCRTARGVFALRDTSSSRPPSTARATARSAAAEVESHGKKLGMNDIRALARQIVHAHPEGIRYGQLVTSITDQSPATPPNTIQGAIWNLDAMFPVEIAKPARGLFKSVNAVDADGVEAQEPRTPGHHREDAFYEPFADWLKNDLGDATDAVALGGSPLRSKWGTPDVVGVYKPQASDRIKFPHEIISAEIKVERQAPVVAFGQAVAYRLFSTKTYIVMPEAIAKEDLDRLEALCMLFGVGLVLFTVDPEQPNFLIRTRAQRFSPDMYFVNEFADGLHRYDKHTFNRLFQ